MLSKLAIGAFCAAALPPMTALAQRPAAADPAAAVVPPVYESAFSAYRRYEHERVRDWSQLNEEVGKAGGHIGIFRGAGHAGHGAAKAPAEAPLGEGQPPARGAPKAPERKPHH